ncbi:MAG: hypothetical protein DI548_06775 [Flavobacterium johnsoniae]|nr:MAG: hypothetical protein DI548_06775 [Flavobacterium johnsoniae]
MNYKLSEIYIFFFKRDSFPDCKITSGAFMAHFTTEKLLLLFLLDLFKLLQFMFLAANFMHYEIL